MGSILGLRQCAECFAKVNGNQAIRGMQCHSQSIKLSSVLGYDEVTIEALRHILEKLLSLKEKISFRHLGKKRT